MDAHAVASGLPAQRGLLASVVVPARDCAGDVRELLAALEAQTVPRDCFEVVVGDDGSSDDIRSLETPDGRVRVASGPPRNAYAALRRAAECAHAPALAVCDADSRPEPGWLEAGLAALERAELVGGRIEAIVPHSRTIWTLLYLELNLDQEGTIRRGKCLTGNLFVTRELYDRVGGFDGALASYGDFDFAERCLRAGARLAFAPDAVVGHPTRDDARSFLSRVWSSNYSGAARELRHGRPLRLATNAFYVPLYGMARSRRHRGLPFRLDRRRLAANGIPVRLRDELAAGPITYALLPYLAGLASLRARRDFRSGR
jgi:glycosyltransferase involved in cell wall biosynthesis